MLMKLVGTASYKTTKTNEKKFKQGENLIRTLWKKFMEKIMIQKNMVQLGDSSKRVIKNTSPECSTVIASMEWTDCKVVGSAANLCSSPLLGYSNKITQRILGIVDTWYAKTGVSVNEKNTEVIVFMKPITGTKTGVSSS